MGRSSCCGDDASGSCAPMPASARRVMITLGLSYGFHDSSAALLKDGETVCSLAEERLSLIKHDNSYPALAIDTVLRVCGINSGELNEIAYYEQPSVKYSRILTSSFADFPRGVGRFARANVVWLKEKLWVRAQLSNRLNISPERILLLPHHECHIAQAFFASPFESAAVLIADGVGEWECTTLACANRHQPGVYNILEQYEYPHSIGLVYATLTAFLGFEPNSGEASTMALAAFGRPRYAETLRRIMRPLPDGTYFVDPAYFRFESSSQPWSRRLLNELGEPRDNRVPYSFHSGPSEGQPTADDQRHADIAASLQQVLEEVLLGLCTRLRQRTGSTNICVGGGVAMNCVAISRLIAESGFQRLFVPPDPGDGGAAFGAAMLAQSRTREVRHMSSPYLGPPGPRISAETARNLLERQSAVSLGLEIAERHEEDLLDRVISDIQQGCIVGWIQGKSEVGPRALGNRSLLIDPSNVTAMKRLSHVKSHKGFRPYALSILREDAADALDLLSADMPVFRWMQAVCSVRPAFLDRLKCATHVNGTTRPQIVDEADNPVFHRLLRRMKQATGLGAVLNTSFNERNFPMVFDPAVALAMFVRTDIDTLVIENLLIRKRTGGRP